MQEKIGGALLDSLSLARGKKALAIWPLRQCGAPVNSAGLTAFAKVTAVRRSFSGGRTKGT